jgi:hypothetical protein
MHKSEGELARLIFLIKRGIHPISQLLTATRESGVTATRLCH